jgi:polyphosphate kinase 2 (PPK2 family)
MSVPRADALSYRYYERAVCDVVDRTPTRIAPWTLVEANNKYCARIKVLKTICQALEDGLERLK